MNKKRAILASLAISGGILAACTNDTTDNSGDASEDIELQLWVLNDHTHFFTPAVEAFEDENPHINVEINSRAVDPHKDALQVAASSNTMPHIWYNWGGSLGTYYTDNDLTLDLTEVAGEENWDEIYETAALELVEYDGEMMGIPWLLNGLAVYYRTDIFEEYGLEIPETLEELEQVADTLVENDIVPFSTGGLNGWHTMRITEAIHENYADPDTKDQMYSFETSWQEDSFVQTWETLQRWNNDGYFPEGFISMDPNEVQNLFFSGITAMQVEGAWHDRNIENEGFDRELASVFAFPSESGRISSFVEMLQINPNASEEEIEAAVELGKHLSSAETFNQFDAPQYPVAAQGVEIPDHFYNLETFVDLLDEGAYVITDQALPQELVNRYFEIQDEVLLENLTPEEAAEEFDLRVENYNN